MRFLLITLSILFSGANLLFAQQTSGFISVKMHNQTWKNGMIINYEAEYFYDRQKGVMVSAYKSPKEFIKITNRKGELKLYFPKDNKVTLTQNNFFSSENEILYYFVNNQIQDLGLEKEGFFLSDSRMEDNLLIFTWTAPPHMNLLSKVEMVFEGETPIYSAYFDKDNKVVKKIYYYEYAQTKYFQLPMKITEITYTPKQDSMVQRMTFTDLNIQSSADSPYFNFQIPENAKVENANY